MRSGQPSIRTALTVRISDACQEHLHFFVTFVGCCIWSIDVLLQAHLQRRASTGRDSQRWRQTGQPRVVGHGLHFLVAHHGAHGSQLCPDTGQALRLGPDLSASLIGIQLEPSVKFLPLSGHATRTESCPKSLDGDFSFLDHSTPQVDLLLNECSGLFGGAFLQLAAQLCHTRFDLRRI